MEVSGQLNALPNLSPKKQPPVPTGTGRFGGPHSWVSLSKTGKSLIQPGMNFPVVQPVA
jgi:hypothetical protein